MASATTTQTQAPPAGELLTSNKPAQPEHPLTPTSHSVLLNIPLASITPSKTNPRKNFDGEAMRDLVDSIRTHGVLQAVLVRKIGAAKYELVAGERRFRAAKEAGLTQIPAGIRELTDDQVLELQIVENLQREDVTALEEAEGYRQLLEDLKKKLPKLSRTDLVQTIAAKIGKSVRYVWARMKLNELIPELQKDLSEGKIEPSHADELVRLCAKDQKAIRDGIGGLFDRVVDGDRQVAVSVRDLKKTISADFQLELTKAPFPTDDAKLVPAAGACGTCLKNSANNPTAEADPKKPACMDRGCFAEKRKAFVAIEALKKVDGDKVKTSTVLKVTLVHSFSYARKKIGDLPKVREEWKTARPGECPHVQPAVVVDCGDTHDQAIRATLVCVNTKCKVHFGVATESKVKPRAGAQKEELPTLAEYQASHKRGFESSLQKATKLELFRRACASVKAIGPKEIRAIAGALADEAWLDHDERLGVFGGEAKVDVAEYVAKLPAEKLPAMIFALLFCGELDRGNYSKKTFKNFIAGIDQKKVAADVKKSVARCEICGCTEHDPCDLGQSADYSTKYCGWVAVNTFGLKHLCSNPRCKEEAAKRAEVSRIAKVDATHEKEYAAAMARARGQLLAGKKRDLTSAELASLADPKKPAAKAAVKKSPNAPSSSPAKAAAPKRTTKNAAKKSVAKKSAKKGGR